ncbi:MAG: hypothetical protein ABIJ47_14190 [Candidatus Bathyarchaeota archaeon]
MDIKDDFIFFKGFTVLIYPQDKEIIKQLSEMKEKRVSILRTDIKNKTYLVRVNPVDPGQG